MKNLIYFTFILLLASCGKKYTATGRVYNPVNGNGIVGLEVQIRKGKACLNYDGCGSKLLESTTTDANGYYSITYRDRGGQYLLFKNECRNHQHKSNALGGRSDTTGGIRCGLRLENTIGNLALSAAAQWRPRVSS